MKPRANCNSGWALVALCCVALPTFAQPAAVTGQITETVHGKPLPTITLTLRGTLHGTPPEGDSYSTQTDAEGRFRIEGVLPGRYSVGFTAQKFVWPLRKDGTSETPAPLTLTPGERHTLDFQLTPTGIISGRTLDAEGDPIRDVSVQAMQYGYNNGKRELNSRASAQSNDRGEYRLYNVSPGTYYLQATSRPNMGGGFAMPNEQIRGTRPPQGFVATYYPNVRDAASGEPLKLAPGDELSRIDIRMVPEMLYTVRVKVLTPAATGVYPVFTLQNRMSGGRNGNFNSGGVNGMGEFRGVLPGSYQLTGTMRSNGNNQEPQSYLHQTVEVVDHDVEIDAPAFAPVFDVTGSVLVDATPPFPLQRIRLTMRREYPDMVQDPNTTLAADGTFVLHGAVPDTYNLTATIPAGAYLKSVKLGTRELPDLHVDLSGGAAPLVILVGTDGGRIKGAVENAAGESSVRTPVTLYPEGKQRDRQDRVKTVATDANGRYDIKDIAPGDYRLYAWESSDLAPSRDPDFRKAYESQSVTVSVTPGGNLVVALKTAVAK